MSRNKHPTSSEIVNTTLIESSNYLERAKVLKRKHDEWEKKQKFEIIRPDHRTVIYRRITGNNPKNSSEIHKGII